MYSTNWVAPNEVKMVKVEWVMIAFLLTSRGKLLHPCYLLPNKKAVRCNWYLPENT